MNGKSALTIKQKESAYLPYSCQARESLYILMEKSALIAHTPIGYIMLVKIPFEFAVRQEKLSNQNVVSLRTRGQKYIKFI